MRLKMLAHFLDTYTHATDAVFIRQLAPQHAYSTDAENISKTCTSWKRTNLVKPQDLSAWYYQFLAHQATQKTQLGLGRVKTGLGLRQPLGDI